MPNSLRAKILATLVFVFGSFFCLAQCKNIDAEVKVITAANDINGQKSIVIDFKDGNKELFKVSLFVPDRQNILNSEKAEFNNLSSGKYLIVIVGKREEDHYCPKSLNATIN